MTIPKEQRAEAGRLAHELELCYMPSVASFLRTIAALPEAEPAAWMLRRESPNVTVAYVLKEAAKHWQEVGGGEIVPLYAHPPAPLTDAPEIEKLILQIHGVLKRGEATQDHGLVGNLRCILDHVLPEPLPDAQHAADTARIAELEAGEPNMRHPKIQALIGGNARSSIELQLVEQILDEGAALETTAMDMEYWNSLHDRAMESMRRIAELEAAIAERNWVLHGVFNLMGGDGSEEVTGLLGRIEAILKEKTSD